MDKVTKEMRSKHYVQFGYMVEDSEILAWYQGKDSKSKKKKEKKIDGR